MSFMTADIPIWRGSDWTPNVSAAAISENLSPTMTEPDSLGLSTIYRRISWTVRTTLLMIRRAQSAGELLPAFMIWAFLPTHSGWGHRGCEVSDPKSRLCLPSRGVPATDHVYMLDSPCPISPTDWGLVCHNSNSHARSTQSCDRNARLR